MKVMKLKSIELRQHRSTAVVHHYHLNTPCWSTLVDVTRDTSRWGWDVRLADGCMLYGTQPTTEFTVQVG